MKTASVNTFARSVGDVFRSHLIFNNMSELIQESSLSHVPFAIKLLLKKPTWTATSELTQGSTPSLVLSALRLLVEKTL